MYDLLVTLRKYLEDNLCKSGDFLKTVRVMSDFEAETLLKTNIIPCLLIAPVGEETEFGPVNNSSKVIMSIKMRLITRSADPNKYRIGDTDKNIYSLTQTIRDLLLYNKMLSGKVFGLRPRFSVKDIDILFGEQAGHFSARDIFIEYERLETWTGNHNIQHSSALPAGITF